MNLKKFPQSDYFFSAVVITIFYRFVPNENITDSLVQENPFIHILVNKN